jgi:hypothetical protein
MEATAADDEGHEGAQSTMGIFGGAQSPPAMEKTCGTAASDCYKRHQFSDDMLRMYARGLEGFRTAQQNTPWYPPKLIIEIEMTVTSPPPSSRMRECKRYAIVMPVMHINVLRHGCYQWNVEMYDTFLYHCSMITQGDIVTTIVDSVRSITAYSLHLSYLCDLSQSVSHRDVILMEFNPAKKSDMLKLVKNYREFCDDFPGILRGLQHKNGCCHCY